MKLPSAIWKGLLKRHRYEVALAAALTVIGVIAVLYAGTGGDKAHLFTKAED